MKVWILKLLSVFLIASKVSDAYGIPIETVFFSTFFVYVADIQVFICFRMRGGGSWLSCRMSLRRLGSSLLLSSSLHGFLPALASEEISFRFTHFGWAELKSKYLSECVDYLWMPTLNFHKSLTSSWQSWKPMTRLVCSDSIVNFMDLHCLLRAWRKLSFCACIVIVRYRQNTLRKNVGDE